MILYNKYYSFVCVCFAVWLSQLSHANGATKRTGQESIGNKLENKVSQLWDWTQQRTIIQFTSYDSFQLYLRTKPRNYSVVLMLTALRAERGCQVCREAKDEYKIVADSFRFSYGHRDVTQNKLLFFAMTDFDEGGGTIFEALHLKTAPVFIHYPPVGKPKASDKFDLSRQGLHAEALAQWISDVSGLKIRIFRPPNYTLLFGVVLLFILMMVGGYWMREQLDSFYNPIYWSMLSIAIVLVMISGQMWNQIRGPPMLHRDPNTGATGFFSGSSHYQFVAETGIVFALYGGITFSLIMLNHDLLPIKSQSVAGVPSRGLSSLGGLILFVLIFSYLLSIFKMKYQGYPYSFLLFG